MRIRIEYSTRIFCESSRVDGVMQLRPLKTETTIDIESVRWPVWRNLPRVGLMRGGHVGWQVPGGLKAPYWDMEIDKLFLIYRPGIRLPQRSKSRVVIINTLDIPSFNRIQIIRQLSTKEPAEVAQACAGVIAMLTQGVTPVGLAAK